MAGNDTTTLRKRDPRDPDAANMASPRAVKWSRSSFDLLLREIVRTETGGADQWVLKRREIPGFARVNKVTLHP